METNRLRRIKNRHKPTIWDTIGFVLAMVLLFSLFWVVA